MPYGASEIPAAVKGLPSGAQSIFKGAFNSFSSANPKKDEQHAFRVAWAAVKNKYKKNKLRDAEDLLR